MTERIFHKTVVQITILSEEEIGSVTAEEIAYQTNDGEWSGRTEIASREEIDGSAMAKELIDQASDPEFFCLTPEGDDIEGCGEDEPEVSED